VKQLIRKVVCFMFIGFMTKEVFDMMKSEKRIEAEKKIDDEKASKYGNIIAKGADTMMRLADQKSQLDLQRLMMEENMKKRDEAKAKAAANKKAPRTVAEKDAEEDAEMPLPIIDDGDYVPDDDLEM
jgi:hypothetical protein